MAFQGFGSDDEDEVMADINVTPLVDVMLVLLIIFMIATPMLHQGKEVELPKVDSETIPMREEDPMVLTVTKQDVIFIKDDPVHISQLVEQLLPLMERRSNKTVFLKGDKEVPYGSVMEVIGTLNRAGVTQVALVTAPLATPERR
jgi:TolR protein